MAVIGPAVGGVSLVGLGWVSVAFACNTALTFLVSLLCLLRVREPRRAAAAEAGSPS